MIVCGIDPGLNGGITFIHGESIESYPMPTINVGKKNVLDSSEIASLLKKNRPDRVAIEKVNAMPGQGVTSMFSFGYGAGILEGIVACLGIPFELVTPQRWMKIVLTGLDKSEGTKSSILWCQRRYPQIDWRKNEKCRTPHDGKTDSACIAYYLSKQS